MNIAFNEDGSVHSVIGYRTNYNREVIDNLQNVEGYRVFKVYDAEVINRAWEALDTGGSVQVELDGNGNPVGVIAENGDLDPPKENDVTPTPKPKPEEEVRQLKQTIADLEFTLMMGGVI